MLRARCGLPGRGGSASHVQDGIAVGRFLLQNLESAGRRQSSSFTSFITGNAPVPVPTTRRRHFQGIFSSTESGVCPKASRNFLEGFFLRLRTSPRSIITRSEEHTSELQSRPHLVCRLLLEKKKKGICVASTPYCLSTPTVTRIT